MLAAYERAIMEDAERYDATAHERKIGAVTETSQAGTLLTPDNIWRWRRLVLRSAGKPGGPTKERAERMAQNHRVLSRGNVIASRSSGRSALARARRRHTRLQRS